MFASAMAFRICGVQACYRPGVDASSAMHVWILTEAKCYCDPSSPSSFFERLLGRRSTKMVEVGLTQTSKPVVALKAVALRAGHTAELGGCRSAFFLRQLWFNSIRSPVATCETPRSQCAGYGVAGLALVRTTRHTLVPGVAPLCLRYKVGKCRTYRMGATQKDWPRFGPCATWD
jgi:hypothetical protein